MIHEGDVDGTEPTAPAAAVPAQQTGREHADPTAAKARRFGPGLEFNAFALMASTAITALVGLGFWAIAARLPPAEVGRASAMITTATMLSQLSGSNIGVLFSRVLPAAGRRSTAVVLAGYAVAIAIALVLTGAFLLFFTSDELFVSGLERALFPLLVITFVLFALQDWVLTGIRATGWIPVEQLLFSLAKMGLLIWFVAAAVENAIVLAWAIPCLATVLVINPLLLGRVLPRRPPAPEGASAMPGRRALGRIFLAEYATGAVTFVIPLTLPLLVLTQLGAEANAYYALPWLIAESLGLLIWNISSSYMVEASHDNRQMGALMSRTLRLSFLVGGLGVPFIVLTAPWLLSFLGSNYAAEGTTVLRLMVLAIPFNIIFTMFLNTSRVRNQMGRVVVTQLVSAVLIISLTAALLPVMGIDGAGWAYLIAEAVMAVVVAVPLLRFMRANQVRLFGVSTPRAAPSDPDPTAESGTDPDNGSAESVRLAQPYRSGRART
ncbi:MAG TPA: polysaccharide biosynthesis C-terminal domain-containing protein [Pseudonocardia sp.]|nr:polysaccharide biosynthesis C-terminal domain-containing protein [Pseudonocardia sp.]